MNPVISRRRTLLGSAFAGLATPTLVSATTGNTFLNLGLPLRLTKEAPPLTPIAALNRQMRELADRRNEMDIALISFKDGCEPVELRQAFDASLDELLALRDRVAELPAKTLEDVAIQATMIFYFMESVYAPDDESETNSIRALSASIIKAIVKAADLDIDRLGWGEMRRLCDLRAPQGGT